MESVGQKLRRARLSHNLSLGDIHTSTRIPVRILEAIENDQPERLNGAAFYKSFVRQFAAEVQIDYAEIAPAVQAIVAVALPEHHGPAVTTHYAPRSVAIRSFRSGRLHSLLTFASFVVVLAACSYVYSAWQRSGSKWRDVGTKFATLRSKPGSGVAGERPDIRSQASSASQNPQADPYSPAKQSDFLIQLSALERTWLSIVADGKQTFNGILEKAETKTLQGKDVARIRAGNAGGVSVVFNGKELGTLGPRGQVRVAVFTKNGYEVLRPPGHVAMAEITVTGE